MWTNRSGCNKAYYIKEFNPNCVHGNKTYLGESIKGKLRLLVAQLRMGSHHLRYDTNRWRVLKKVWEERTCIFYNKGVVEMEQQFFIECASYKDIHIQYENSLNVNNMHCLFEKDKINLIAILLVNIHRRRSNIEKDMKMSQGCYSLGPLGCRASWISSKSINQQAILYFHFPFNFPK